MGTTHVESRWHRATGDEIVEDFLMTIVGGSDHWLFLSSTGALTAGRQNAQQAIFSYETEDRLHRLARASGPRTTIRAGATTWNPWTRYLADDVDRTLEKRTLGDGVRFTERHSGLGLTFAYEWKLSEEFGFVRECRLSLDATGQPLSVNLVDGLAGILPHGVDPYTQQTASVLVDAYKHAETIADGQIGLFSLTSQIVDRPEPAEALRCTVAWVRGLPNKTTFLDAHQADAFERGESPSAEELRLGRPSGFFVNAQVELSPGESVSWQLGVDIGWSAERVVALAEAFSAADFESMIERSVVENRARLRTFVARADGLQSTGEPVRDDRHATNVMFNCMRGGVFATDRMLRADLIDFISTRNRAVAQRHANALQSLDVEFLRDDLLALAADAGDPDLERLAIEYLPLTFSRRHGDPSRPWNTFSINVRNPDGSQRFDYEGNWRDVFQNWEALLTSFPEFIESAWTVFVNATTADGHNPYRITRDGIDWERPDPDDPWAHIGYWGDHQIIYLLKLLELGEAHFPGRIQNRLNDPIYTFADVPYRIGSYAEIVADPHETITFDREHDRHIDARREATGADGNLVHDGDEIVRATLGEKLLISVLAKLGNFVPDGGIWMNTQRPEWNDANNALVGNGLSMVTLAYLVRHLSFLHGQFDRDGEDLQMHAPVAKWLRATAAVFASHDLTSSVPDNLRREVLDELGEAAEAYRVAVYANGLGELASVTQSEVCDLLEHATTALTATLRGARRSDGLFHGYNLIALDEAAARVEPLPLMLEGQVAALSAGALEPNEVVQLVDSLFDGPLYRADQNTFLLYPETDLPRFLDRGIIPPNLAERSEAIRIAVEVGESRLVTRDARGVYRFGGALRNAKDLEKLARELSTQTPFRSIGEADWDQLLGIWESVFHHHAYTGRSGSMYGYEGIGSVYWHMVSKLILAAQENVVDARRSEISNETTRLLVERYYRLRSGLGDAKTFEEYGAFPTDAYSHTPPRGGARQPGMTGQVKEDILSRRGELGVFVREGEVSFDPFMLRADEFLTSEAPFHGVDRLGRSYELQLSAGQLAFTLCQVPVVYSLSDEPDVRVTVHRSGGAHRLDGASLDAELSRALFGRDQALERIDVSVPRALLG